MSGWLREWWSIALDLWQNKPFVALTLAVVAVAVGLPGVARGSLLYTLTVSLYYVVLAVSWNLIAGYTGRFSLAQQAFATLGAYGSGLLTSYTGMPVWIGILAGVGVAVVSGLLLGVVVLRMRDAYLALTTWAFAGVVQVGLTSAYEITRGDMGLIVKPLYNQITYLEPYYYTFLTLATGCSVVAYLFVHSSAGMYARAIRDDELRAATLGVDTTQWKLVVFMLSSGFSGLAGALYAHLTVVLSPSMADFSEMAKIIAMVMWGGMGSFAGPLIGAPILELIGSWLRSYGAWDIVLYALGILVVVRWQRGGLVALVASGLDRMHSLRQGRSRASMRHSANS